MKKTIKELLEERATLVNQARQIYDDAEKENREPTDEERSNFDKAMTEADKLKDQADQMQGDLERRARLVATEKELTESRGRQTNWEQANKGTGNQPKMGEPEIIELRKSVCGDRRRVVLKESKEESQQLIQDYMRFLLSGRITRQLEERALQKDSDVAGGFLSAPMKFQADLIKDLDDEMFMRQICRVLPPLKTATSLGVPVLASRPANPTWVAELSVGSADTSMAFGRRELSPHPAASYILVSKKLLRSSEMDVEQIVRGAVVYEFNQIQENTFLNGNGAQQPLGIFTASGDGISTGRDVSTGNTTTSMSFDGLIEAYYSLKAQYRKKLSWIFHRDGVKQIRKFKDGEGRYIWQASLIAGEPDTILATRVFESEYAPNTFESGLYVGMLGNFQYYWIVDALTFELTKLIELGALTNQDYFIGRIEADAMPVHENAFARVKLA